MSLSRRLVLVLLLALGLAGAASAQKPIPTYFPGPWPVGHRHWDFGLVDVNLPGSGGSQDLAVQHFGVVYYPAVAAGEAMPGASAVAFPLVVFGHGRFQVGSAVGTNHLQAGYLCEHLASWGFVVASVNLDVVGQYGSPAAIVQRGQLVHHTIDRFEVPFADLQVDASRIGVLGHSRGGEGAMQAWFRNDERHPILAVGTIAPTSFLNREVEGVPYYSVYGSKDGDVNNGWPIHAYDRAFGAEKGFAYVEGANHFWFTEDLHFGGEGNADISRPLHHEIARTTLAWFLVRTIGRPEPLDFAELCDGSNLFPVTNQAAIHPMYSRPGGLVLDDFEDAPVDPLVNSVGGAARPGNLATYEEQWLGQAAATLYHRTSGAAVAWSGTSPAPFLVQGLPAPFDASGLGHVSLRAAQLLDAPENASGLAQDLRVALIDAEGDRAFVPLSHFGTIPWPVTHPGPAFPRKSVLRTTRVPLTAFTFENPSLDLDRLLAVGLVFDVTGAGDLRIDDVELTH